MKKLFNNYLNLAKNFPKSIQNAVVMILLWLPIFIITWVFQIIFLSK